MLYTYKSGFRPWQRLDRSVDALIEDAKLRAGRLNQKRRWPTQRIIGPRIK